MTIDRLIKMIVNSVVRHVLRRGINLGIDYVAGKGKPGHQMTAGEKKQASDARAVAKRARQAAKVTRRLGR